MAETKENQRPHPGEEGEYSRPGDLGNRIAKFLEEEKDDLRSQLEREIEESLEEYRFLPADVASDVEETRNTLLELSIEYYRGGTDSLERIQEFASDLGRRRAEQDVKLDAVLGGFDLSEDYCWERAVQDLIQQDYPPSDWLEIFRLRDEYRKTVKKSIREAFMEYETGVIQRQMEELRGLLQIGETIASTIDLDAVLPQILEVATSMLRVKMGSILLLDEEGRRFYPAAGRGLTRSWLQRETILKDRSLAGVALRRREPVLAVDNEIIGFDVPSTGAGRKLRSVLSVPITAGEQPIGVMEMYDVRPRTYSDFDLAVIETFAPQAGVAIQNAKLFEAEQKRRRQANVLTEVAQSLGEARNLEELLDVLAAKATEALDVDRCSLFFLDPKSKEMSFVAGHGRSTLQVWLLNQFHIPLVELGESTARAIHTKKPVAVERAKQELCLESRIFRGSDVKSYLQAPMIYEDSVIGVMSLEYSREPHRFTEEEISFATALARQAAIAIENRRLQEKIVEQQVVVRNAEINEILYREREKSEAMLRATPDAVFLIDGDLKIEFLNPAAEFLTGWTAQEAKGRSCHEVLYGYNISPEDCQRRECPIKELLAGEKVPYREDVLSSRSGSEVRVGGTFAAIYGPGGKVENVIAIYRDITEQKELESYGLMQRELEIASTIQDRMLPGDRLEANGVRVFARLRQAKAIGGDWYDFWLQDGKLTLVVGDASGHGIPATLLATMAMSAMRVKGREHKDVLGMLNAVNTSLYYSSEEENFVTVFVGMLDLETKVLSFANAGHEDPLLVRCGRKSTEMLQSEERSLLGAFPDILLSAGRVRMEKGDRLVVYTDGLVEARSRKGRFYGFKRFNRYASNSCGMDPEEFLEGVFRSILKFSDRDLRDDVTIVVCDID